MRKTRDRGGGKSKLIYTGIALLVTLTVLALGSYAWLTLSTNPEISGINIAVNADRAILVSTDNENFSHSEELNLESYAPLVPSSTVDGLNWFISKYDMKGDVLQEPVTKDGITTSQFKYLRFPEGGNMELAATLADDDPVSSSSAAADPTEDSNADLYSYYIYTDIYLKTEDKKGAKVYLSLPSATNYEADDTEKNHYGTYALSYTIDEINETGADGKEKKVKKISLSNQMAESSVRVGFLVIGEANEEVFPCPENEQVTSNVDGSYPFYILEPNADSRSYTAKENADFNADQYIAGFNAQYTSAAEHSYSNSVGYYYQTYPIGITAKTKALLQEKLNTQPAEGDEKEKNQYILEWDGSSTFWPSDSHKETIDVDPSTEEVVVDGEISVFPSDHLIIQGSSSWKSQTELEKDDATGNKIQAQEFDSTMVESMGRFLKEDTDPYQDKTDLAGDNTDYSPTKLESSLSEFRSSVCIAELEKDKPQKVRIYFWLEGQDVDTWNDISHSNFLVNLEFVGDIDGSES